MGEVGENLDMWRGGMEAMKEGKEKMNKGGKSVGAGKKVSFLFNSFFIFFSFFGGTGDETQG